MADEVKGHIGAGMDFFTAVRRSLKEHVTNDHSDNIELGYEVISYSLWCFLCFLFFNLPSLSCF